MAFADRASSHRGATLAGLAASGAAAAARSLSAAPSIQLRASSVAIQATPSEVVAAFRDHVAATPGLLCVSGDTAVARFAGRAGPYQFATAEVIRFNRAAVQFEHLAGPFQSCNEQFAITDNRDGTSNVVHEGTIRMRHGLLGWLLGFGVARPLFEMVSERELRLLPQRLGLAQPASSAHETNTAN